MDEKMYKLWNHAWTHLAALSRKKEKGATEGMGVSVHVSRPRQDTYRGFGGNVLHLLDAFLRALPNEIKHHHVRLSLPPWPGP